jgi:GNAT superfamily N-acetyltransferase
VDLTPLHGPEIFELFKQRGYAIAELNNVLYRKLDPEEAFPSPPAGFEIRRSLPEEADITGAIVESAFFPEGAPEPFRGLIAPLYQMETALAFVATKESKPVACGTGIVIAEHSIFALCGAGTLAPYRGRGLQTALLRSRISAAIHAGCEYAVVVTQGGTTSQRNAERLGFRVAYSKVTVIKPLDS